jgi:hypothetical protein
MNRAERTKGKKTKTNNPAVTFHTDFQALRAKYPMVYLEAWTPDDFVVDEDGNGSPEPVDWNDSAHIATADNLDRHFDAEYGTNWERVRDAAN